MGRVLPLAALLGLLLVPAARAECSLTLGWEPYPPFEMEGPDGRLGGVDVELLTLAAAEAGCRIVPKPRPWLRLLDEIRDGETDAATDATVTAERSAWARFSVPYRNDRFVLFVRKGETGRLPGGIAEIAKGGFRLGAVRGFAYGAPFEALMRDPHFASNVEFVAGTETNLKMLMAGHIDGFVENLDSGRLEIAQARLDGAVELHPVPLNSEDVAFMFSRKSVDPAIVDRIDAALTAMRKDGRAARILGSYSE